MATFNVAHIREQGQDIIIVIVDREPTPADIRQLQICANNAGLRGTVVPVWESMGRFAFIAPRPWHPFFRSLTWDVVLMSVNKRLTCS